MRYPSLLFFLIYAINVNAQFSFVDRTNFLSFVSVNSGAPIAISDMNGDGLDDLVRLDNTQSLKIDYQPSFGDNFTGLNFGSLFGAQWSICIADVDGNGYNDIFTGGAYNGLKLLKANGNGTSFSLTTISQQAIFLQCSNFADIDNDGHNDIFACHDDGLSHPYRNNGSGGFALDYDLINTASTVPSDNSGNYGSVWTDYDNDGDLDLYISKCRLGVTNPMDGRRLNLLFQNDGNGNYTDVAEAAGLRPMAQSWAADFADIDNDGDLDCFIINHDQPDQLYLNNGFGIFTDITAQSGMSADLASAGAGVQVKFVDFDNDTYVDLLYTSLGASHRLFRNNGDNTFTNLTATIPTGGLRIQSASVGDLNNDGFMDIVAGFGNSYNAPSNHDDKMFFNNGNGNNFLKVKLEGVTSNPNGIGARIELHGLWGQQVREVRSGESYGIMTSLTQHFGLASLPIIDSLIVRWPSGVKDVLINPPVNQTLNIVEGSACQGIIGFNALIQEQTVTFTDQSTIGATQWLWDFGDGNTSTEQNPVHTYNEEGVYEVCLQASGICGSGEVCLMVNVDCAIPQSIFGAEEDGLTVTFTDFSQNNPQDWLWTFGDATSSTEQNPVHSFGAPGTYLVCLQVANNCGSSQFCDFITVGCENIQAGFSYQSTNLDVIFSDLSTGGPSTWTWDFGDGNTSTEQNPMHSYDAPGTYMVCLEVGGACGQETTCINLQLSCPAPGVGFSYASQGLTHAFTNTSESSVTSYNWDFGDGGSATEPNPLHIYQQPGSYEVCLEVSNICGTNQICQEINVVCAAPGAGFGFQSDELLVDFSDLSTNNPTEWNWDFGDGTQSDNASPLHAYALPGTYQVCLSVSSVCGSSEICQPVTVSCIAPEAAFTQQADGYTLQFQDLSTNSPTEWTWTFGDGATSDLQNPEHTFELPGTYIVCLQVSSVCGSMQTCDFVEVICLEPEASYSYSENGLSLAFEDNSANNPDQWEWTFGDGSASNAQNPTHTYAQPGTFEVCLQVSSICGENTICQNIEVSCVAPQAGFDFTNEELVYSFSDNSANGPTSWTWSFGDGNNSFEQNPGHTYAMPGTYTVCLTVSSICGTTQVCEPITVTCTAPQASFNFAADELSLDFNDTSTENPEGWIWSFGDGGTSALQNPSYTYGSPGTYQVCLEASGLCGSTEICQTITVSCSAPATAFTYEANQLALQFTDNSSNSPTEWVWDFGDGNTATDQNPFHQFDEPGVYEVCLQASSVCGTTTTCQSITVICFAPQAEFSSGGEELTIDFTDSSSNGPNEWIWNFGDGESSTEQNPQHTYAMPGNYVVCLEVFNDCGNTQRCELITVTCSAPEADFATEAGNLVINFLDISTNNPEQWAWTFGDGNTSTEQNPTYAYEEPGTYEVCLQVLSVCGNSQICQLVEVGCAAPEAAFSVSSNDLQQIFLDASTNNPTSWEWDFGDGGTSTAQNPVHTYAEASNYTVCLIASSICGSDTICQIINIVTDTEEPGKALPRMQISPNPTSGFAYLQLENLAGEEVRLRITDLKGQPIQGVSLKISADQTSERLDVRSLPPGVYLVIVESSEGRLVERLVKAGD